MNTSFTRLDPIVNRNENTNHEIRTTIITKAVNPDEYEFTCGCKGMADSLKLKGTVRRIKK